MNATKTDLQEQADDLAYFAEAIEHFETHDIGDELANSPEVHFEISPQARSRYYFEVEPELRMKLQSIAKQRGVPTKTLLNEWVRERTAEIEAVSVGK